MTNRPTSRRAFLQSTTTLAAASLVMSASPRAIAAAPKKHAANANSRLQIGCIGLRYQGTVIADKSRAHGDIVALCDVDRNVRDQARASFGSTAKLYEDYRELLESKDIDVVTIGAPDHWHAKMLIDACRAGKDVYCEKPLTLTIDEGKLVRKVVDETNRVVQVGSWQRSDDNFRRAAELIRQGRLGKLKSVEVVLGPNETGGPFPASPPPPNLNWDLWLGQAPETPFIYQRSHYTFRWWYEYAGGQLTDWGAHHIDIAQWAINEFPIEVEGTGKLPEIKNGYNVPIDFHVRLRYPSGVEMTVTDKGRNGIMFVGEEGRLFVNRGTLSGKIVSDLKQNPLPREKFTLYDFDNLERPPRSGKLDAIVNHMGNFFDCVEARRRPISDVESQHRAATTCHIANISTRLGRALKWDAQSETFAGDAEANSYLKREQRPQYAVV